jgi:hypothetical protein
MSAINNNDDISSIKNEDLKKYIINESKDLEKCDYIDIITILKTKMDNLSIFKTTQKGTYIDLDDLNRENLIILYSIIHSKIQRIKEESS